ncbi:hypothetical protein Taro_004043 [Colocasia esculenta]|uniref:Uncharacterized protein n=1 Tax=Colocasia esculenta TaxID=4460 RepID=A0A843TIX8_COLES|nr:hypothetical protein [Colocasia esculenta]
MDDAREDNPSTVCCFHPREVVVGVCALCLKERLLVLAARQGRQARRRSFSRAPSKKPSIAIPKVFAFGSSLLHRLDSRHVQDSAWDGDFDSDDSTESLDDSFISIKFEDDGQLSWDKKGPQAPHPGTSSSAAQCSSSSPLAAAAGAQSLVEHPKRRDGSIRWRKRFGHLLRLPRWKRTSKASICNVGSTGKTAEGASGRRTRSLAKARTTE